MEATYRMPYKRGIFIEKQPFCLVISITDPSGGDIYTETINHLRERGFSYNNLEVQNIIRQKYNI